MITRYFIVASPSLPLPLFMPLSPPPSPLPPPLLPSFPPPAQSSKGGSFKSKSKATPPNPSTSSGPTRSSHRAVKRPRTYDEDLAELEIQMQKVTKKPKGTPKGGVSDFIVLYSVFIVHTIYTLGGEGPGDETMRSLGSCEFTCV